MSPITVSESGMIVPIPSPVTARPRTRTQKLGASIEIAEPVTKTARPPM